MNRTQLIGRLTKDVEMKYTQSGVAVSTFTLAVNRPFKNKNGNNDADFIRTQVWRKPAENVANYCKKGSQVAVTGRIQTSSFQGQDGKMVYMTEVVADYVEFLDTRNGNGTNNKNNQAQQRSQQENPYQNQKNPGDGEQQENANSGQTEPIDINDQDLPF